MPNIEDHIRKAIEDGQFDDLPGKGKPIRWDDNPFVEPDWQLAYRMLRDAGFALPWMDTRKEIETQQKTARASLKRAWAWRQLAMAAGQPPAFVDDEWQRALSVFQEQIAEINQRIFDYNLEVPLPRFQRPPVDAQAEITDVIRAEPAEPNGEMG
jgi:DnaJ family protein C protein 28